MEGRFIALDIMSTIFGMANPRELTSEQPYRVLAGTESLSHHPAIHEVVAVKECLKAHRTNNEDAVVNLFGAKSNAYCNTPLTTTQLTGIFYA